MYQAKSGVKNFSLYWGGSLCEKFFSSLNMYQAKSGVKNFSLYWGGSLCENFFSSLNMYQAKSGVKIFFHLLGGGGVPLWKIFFRSEHVSSQIWCQKFFPLLVGGYLGYPPRPEMGYLPDLVWGTPPTWTWDGVPPPWTWDWVPSQTWDGVPPQTWDGVPPWTWDGVPPQTWDRVPPYLDLRWGTPPTWTWDGVPPLPRPEMGYPPPGVDRLKIYTSRHPSDAGGNKCGIFIYCSRRVYYSACKSTYLVRKWSWPPDKTWSPFGRAARRRPENQLQPYNSVSRNTERRSSSGCPSNSQGSDRNHLEDGSNICFMFVNY